MFCTKCGVKNPEDAKFCYKCGNEMYGTKDNYSNNKIVNNNEKENEDVEGNVDKNIETFTTIFRNKYTVEDDYDDKGNEDEVSVNPLASFWGGILDFYGKLGRRDFWAAVIIMAAINIVILALCLWVNFVPFWWLYDVIFFVATLSASVRRLHDTNRSGAYVLLNLIPFVGQIILLVMLLQKGVTKSYVNPRWDGVMAIATIVLVMGGFLVGGVVYSDYQHQQEVQDEVSYDSDYDY